MDLAVLSGGYLCTSLMPKGTKCFIFIELTKVFVTGEKKKKTPHILDGTLEVRGKQHVSTLSGGEFQMHELLSTSIRDLRPRDHS